MTQRHAKRKSGPIFQLAQPVRYSLVILRFWLVLLGVSAWIGGIAAAEEWKVYRHEGRDYVSLDNLASFYGLPAPPTVTGSQPPPPAPAKPAPTPSANGEVPADSGSIAPQPADARSIVLNNGKSEFSVVPNGREAEINGVKQWLAFPTIVQDGHLLVSRLDLAKSIEPRLRPEKVTGLQPVTTVIIDPGHGGHDNGAPSKFGFEKDFALDIALRARQILEKRGFKVVMTRSADIFIPLPERPAAANHIRDSIFVSIHFNSTSSNPAARGFEIYSCAPRGAPATNDGGFSVRDLRDEPGNAVDTQSAVLAGTIFHSLLGHVPMPDRGIKNARFAVLRLCSQPAVLIECGFMSNAADSSLIASPAWREQVAASIVTGIEGYKELAEMHQAPKMMADYRKMDAAEAAGPGQ